MTTKTKKVRVWCQATFWCGWVGYRRPEIAERKCPRCGGTVRA